MRGKCGHRSELVGANTHANPAVAAVLRRKNQLLSQSVVVALRPAIVAALFQQHHLFGRQRCLLLRFEERRPIRIKLVAPVLGYENVLASRVDPKSFRVAYPSRVALRR